MLLAINYSDFAETAYQHGRAPFDIFKCPMWDFVIHKAAKVTPIYVHFPLEVGRGIGDAYNSETKTSADWTSIENCLDTTRTKYINIHLGTTIRNLPGIAVDSLGKNDIERIISLLLKDLKPVIRHFGSERVILENLPIDISNSIFYANTLPEVIKTVVEETGCGFLFDLSHARLAAYHLNMPFRQYALSLPLNSLRDVHVSGVHRIEGVWVDRINALDEELSRIARPAVGGLIDHLPMSEQDWLDFEWFLLEMVSRHWSRPYTVTFEYGGVDPLWSRVTEESVITTQTARFKALMNLVSVSQ